MAALARPAALLSAVEKDCLGVAPTTRSTLSVDHLAAAERALAGELRAIRCVPAPRPLGVGVDLSRYGLSESGDRRLAGHSSRLPRRVARAATPPPTPFVAVAERTVDDSGGGSGGGDGSQPSGGFGDGLSSPAQDVEEDGQDGMLFPPDDAEAAGGDVVGDAPVAGGGGGDAGSDDDVMMGDASSSSSGVSLW